MTDWPAPVADPAREQRATALGMAMTFGYAELSPDGRHLNTSIYVAEDQRSEERQCDQRVGFGKDFSVVGRGTRENV